MNERPRIEKLRRDHRVDLFECGRETRTRYDRGATVIRCDCPWVVSADGVPETDLAAWFGAPIPPRKAAA